MKVKFIIFAANSMCHMVLDPYMPDQICFRQPKKISVFKGNGYYPLGNRKCD